MVRTIAQFWRAISYALAAWVAFACAQAAHAEDTALDLFSRETLQFSGDVRIEASDGEKSWVDGQFGKLRYGGTDNGNMRARPELGEAALVWKPRFTWSLSATVVGVAQGEGRTEAGLSEAYLTFKPLGGGRVRFSARAGLMYPPVSLENGGADWGVVDTITPSAINSWIAEEVKVTGAEVTARARIGEHTLSATGAIFDLNDTAGALLSFRGWAMHDRRALLGRKQPLPPLNRFISFVQPGYTHPTLNPESGFLEHPGFYTKLSWDLPAAVHLELFRYGNNGEPEASTGDDEWGWRTRFTEIGISADLTSSWQLRAQVLTGTAKMGFPRSGHAWVENRFRAVYAMVTRHFARGGISLRTDLFDTRNSGSAVLPVDDETGWALTAAAKRSFGTHFEGLIEFLHVESTRAARLRSGLAPHQVQNQLQFALRLRL